MFEVIYFFCILLQTVIKLIDYVELFQKKIHVGSLLINGFSKETHCQEYETFRFLLYATCNRKTITRQVYRCEVSKGGRTGDKQKNKKEMLLLLRPFSQFFQWQKFGGILKKNPIIFFYVYSYVYH